MSDKAIQERGNYFIKDIFAVFFRKTTIILVINKDKFKFTKKIKVGVDKEKSPQFFEKTLFFAIVIWRNNFIETTRYMPVVQVEDDCLLDQLQLNGKDIFKQLYEIIYLKYANSIALTTSKAKTKVGEIGVANCLIWFDKQNSFLFSYPNFGYSKVIVKFTEQSITLVNLYLQSINLIKLSQIQQVFISESRLVIVLYINLNEKNANLSQIVLFNHKIDDEEYNDYLIIIMQLIEMKRAEKATFELNFSTVKEMLGSHILLPFSVYYDFLKNDRNAEKSGIQQDKQSLKTDFRSDARSTMAQTLVTAANNSKKKILEYQRDCCDKLKQSCTIF
jgi:hypothetical protein